MCFYSDLSSSRANLFRGANFRPAHFIYNHVFILGKYCYICSVETKKSTARGQKSPLFINIC